jgi:hypothetical protein
MGKTGFAGVVATKEHFGSTGIADGKIVDFDLICNARVPQQFYICFQ